MKTKKLALAIVALFALSYFVSHMIAPYDGNVGYVTEQSVD